jgi:hypothetical protein
MNTSGAPRGEQPEWNRDDQRHELGVDEKFDGDRHPLL